MPHWNTRILLYVLSMCLIVTFPKLGSANNSNKCQIEFSDINEYSFEYSERVFKTIHKPKQLKENSTWNSLLDGYAEKASQLSVCARGMSKKVIAGDIPDNKCRSYFLISVDFELISKKLRNLSEGSKKEQGASSSGTDRVALLSALSRLKKQLGSCLEGNMKNGLVGSRDTHT